MIVFGAMPLGAAIGGGAAEVVGIRPVFVAAGAAILLQLLLLPIVSNETMDDAERAAGSLESTKAAEDPA